MRQVELHVPFETVEAFGFDSGPADSDWTDVRDITFLSCDGTTCLVTVTYSTAVDEAFDADAPVEAWEALARDEEAVTYLCQTILPDMAVEPALSPDVILDIRAVAIRSNGFTLTLIAEQDALTEVATLDALVDTPVTLRRLTDYRGPTDGVDVLTDKQREVLETAYERGYFEIPREATAADIAVELDLNRSTVTEHLRRAERNVVGVLLD